jgi:DNA-binding NarL/FixJ family response regulator
MANALSETHANGTPHGAPRSEKIRIYHIDDDGSVLKTLARICSREQDLDVVGAQTCAELALPDIFERKPDVVVTDLRMAKMSGIDCARHLRKLLPNLKILLLTGYADQTNIVDAFRVGVNGYLVKPVSTTTLPDAIRKVFEGNPVISDYALSVLIQSFQNITRRSVSDRLSARECEVMGMIMMGKRDKEIAQELNLTLATVHTHTRRIYAKLDVHNWKEAVNVYLGKGDERVLGSPQVAP